MKEMPDQINVTFTKADRMNANFYQSRTGCLMATALTRMGYNHSQRIFVDYEGNVDIGDYHYTPTTKFHPDQLTDNQYGADGNGLYGLGKRPFYKKEVVGRTVTLVKENDESNY